MLSTDMKDHVAEYTREHQASSIFKVAFFRSERVADEAYSIAKYKAEEEECESSW